MSEPLTGAELAILLRELDVRIAEQVRARRTWSRYRAVWEDEVIRGCAARWIGASLRRAWQRHSLQNEIDQAWEWKGLR